MAKLTFIPEADVKTSETPRPTPSDAGEPWQTSLVTHGPYSIWSRKPPLTGFELRLNESVLDCYPSLESACAQMAWLIELNDGGHLQRLFNTASNALGSRRAQGRVD